MEEFRISDVHSEQVYVKIAPWSVFLSIQILCVKLELINIK